MSTLRCLLFVKPSGLPLFPNPQARKKSFPYPFSLSVRDSIKHMSHCIIITCFKAVSELKVNSSREGCCFITLHVSKGSISVCQIKKPDVSMKKWIRWVGADSLSSEHKAQNSVTSRKSLVGLPLSPYQQSYCCKTWKQEHKYCV